MAAVTLTVTVPAAGAAATGDGFETNGTIHATYAAPNGSQLYVGGDFSYLGPRTGTSVRLDAGGNRTGAWPTFSGGEVAAIVADGAGGFFVGGSFTEVNGVPHRNLAHVAATGIWDRFWAGGAQPDGPVRALQLDGTRVLVGGSFATFGSSTVGTGGLMAITTASGIVDAAFTDGAGFDGDVDDVKVSGASIYVSGAFGTYGGATATRVARLDAAGTLDAAWQPAPNGRVGALHVAGSVVYLAGDFTIAGGQSRRGLAAIATAAPGAATTWNPAPNGAVTSIDLAGTTLYAAGAFTEVGTSPVARRHLAAFSTATGAPLGWDPSGPGSPSSTWSTVTGSTPMRLRVSSSGTTVHVGGPFQKLRGTVRHGMAEVDATSGTPGAWAPHANGTALAFADAGTGLVVGGTFTSADGEPRLGAASIVPGTGEITTWNPTLGDPSGRPVVHAIVYDGVGSLYLGGTFTSPQTGLVAVNAASGAPLAVPTPVVNTGATVRDLAYAAGRIYVVGDFSTIGGESVGRVARFDATSGAVDPAWRPVVGTAGDVVHSIALANPTPLVYFGGSFATPRRNAVAVHIGDGTIQTWNPDPSGPVRDIVVDGTRAWLGGAFATVGGTPQANLAVVNSTGVGTLLASPQTDGEVATLELNSPSLVLGGAFTTVDGVSRPRLARVNAATGAPEAWTTGMTAASPAVQDVSFMGSSYFAAAAGGLDQVSGAASTDDRAPMARIVGIEAPSAGVLVDGTDVLVSGTPGADRSFTVRTRAYDRHHSTDTAAGDVSGVAAVEWGIPTTGSGWQVPAYQAGAAQGLRLECFEETNPAAAGTGQAAIDARIAYDTTHRADDPASLPGALGRADGAGVEGDGSVVDFSCRWNGWLIAPDDSTNPVVLQSVGDAGARTNLGNQGAVPEPGWPTIHNWALVADFVSDESAPVPLAAGEALPLTFEWWENSGAAQAELRARRGTGPMAAIPAGAYVTDVEYTGTYLLPAGSTIATAPRSDVEIPVRDAAGNVTVAKFGLAVDGDGPVASTLAITPSSAGWTSSTSQQLTVQPGADVGDAGVATRLVQRRSGTLTAGACTGWGGWTTIATLPAGSLAPVDIPHSLGTGCHAWQVVDTDRVGNATTSAQAQLRVDAAVPAGGAVSYPSGLRATAALSGTFTLPTDANAGIDTASIKVLRILGELAPTGCGSWDPVEDLPTGAVSVGTGAFSDTIPNGHCARYGLRVLDRAGNVREFIETGVVSVDGTGPSGNLDPSPDGDIRGTVQFSGTAGDTHSLVTGGELTYEHLGSGATARICGPVITFAPVTGSWSCDWNTTARPDGDYRIELVVFDEAGNPSTADSRTVSVDNTAPVVTPQLTAPTGSRAWVDTAASPLRAWVASSVSGSLEVAAAATDAGSGIDTVQLPALGTGWSTAPSPDSVAPFEHLYAWSIGAAAPGGRSIIARDHAGNTATTSIDVRTDAAAPTGGGIEYQDGPTTTATITATAGTDAGSGVATWRVDRREATATGEDTCGAWDTWSELWSEPAGPITDTTVIHGTCYEYRVVTVDRVGNAEVVGHAGGGAAIPTPAGLVVTRGSDPAEGGSSGSMLVRLRARPTAPVSVTLDGDGQVSVGLTDIEFQPAAWNTPVTVVLTATDDARDEASPHPGEVTLLATSAADASYAAMVASTYHVDVVDDDTAGVVVTPATGLTLAEAGAGDGYSVRLSSEPSGPVTVSVEPDAQVSASSTSLTFTPTTWNTSQEVELLAVDDAFVEGRPHVGRVEHTVDSAADPAYDGAPAATVVTAVADDDVASLHVEGAATTIALAEAQSGVGVPVSVRLTAQPTAPVTLAVSVHGGQVATSVSELTFAPTEWNVAHELVVWAIDDTVAEVALSDAVVRLTPASADADFAAIPATDLQAQVRDDDAAELTVRPGAGWQVVDGAVELRESAPDGASIAFVAVGDPTRDIVITPGASPAGQLQVTPASAVIPAGSHANVVSFTVRAVDDRVAEAPTHAAAIAWTVATDDPLYRTVVLDRTAVRIADGVEPQLQEEQPTTKPPREGTPPRDDAPKPDPKPEPKPDAKPERQVETPQPETATPSPGTPAPTQEAPREDAPEAPSEDAPTSEQTPPAEAPVAEDDDDAGADRDRPALQRMRGWAKDHPVAASLAATAGGTALLAAKPLLLAGKLLGSAGGGVPGTPPGLGQLRHLTKLRKKNRQKFAGAMRLLRALGRKLRRRAEEELEDDAWSHLDDIDRAA